MNNIFYYPDSVVSDTAIEFLELIKKPKELSVLLYLVKENPMELYPLLLAELKTAVFPEGWDLVIQSLLDLPVISSRSKSLALAEEISESPERVVKIASVLLDLVISTNARVTTLAVEPQTQSLAWTQLTDSNFGASAGLRSTFDFGAVQGSPVATQEPYDENPCDFLNRTVIGSMVKGAITKYLEGTDTQSLSRVLTHNPKINEVIEICNQLKDPETRNNALFYVRATALEKANRIPNVGLNNEVLENPTTDNIASLLTFIYND